MSKEFNKELDTLDDIYNTDFEYKESLLEKIDDWLFDNVWGYPFLYRLWHNHLKPSALGRKIKFLWQRITRGFDDSETWNLDFSFYHWLYPRLKRFIELNCAYPGNKQFPTFKSWDKELKKRLSQLEKILNEDNFDFNEWSYIPKKVLNEYKSKNLPNSVINASAYYYMRENFDRWFAKYNGFLWW